MVPAPFDLLLDGPVQLRGRGRALQVITAFSAALLVYRVLVSLLKRRGLPGFAPPGGPLHSQEGVPYSPPRNFAMLTVETAHGL